MCPYCHKTFKTYVNCRKHMKIHKHELAQQVDIFCIVAQKLFIDKRKLNIIILIFYVQTAIGGAKDAGEAISSREQSCFFNITGNY